MLTALYIHIPFCKKICTYCDFHKEMATTDKQERYVDALLQELSMHKEQLTAIKTIFIGGGTPSSLPHSLLVKLLTGITELVSLDSVEEYSIETNPNDITEEFVDTILRYGINRVSIGVQSFFQKHLDFMGRTHQEQDIVDAVTLLKQKGVTNISIDMMFALVNQTLDELKVDIKKAIALDVDHISYYSLILEEKTTLYHLYKKNLIQLPSEDIEGDMYEMVMTLLEEAGYDHYEISNFAKASKEAKHNLVYWHNQDYLGIGTGSHSHLGNTRSYHTRNITSYITLLETENRVELFEETCNNLLETMMLGLRLRKGIHLPSIQRIYQIDVFNRFPKLVEFIQDNIIERTDDYLRLTDQGLLIGNEVFELFVEEETC